MNRVQIFMCRILLSTAVLLISSCTASKPEVQSAQACVLFDYSTEESLPRVSLSVFVSTESEYRRVLMMQAEHKGSGLLWTITEPEIVAYGMEIWTGASGLRGGDGIGLPQGMYHITYTDLASQKTEKNCAVSYPVQLEHIHYKDVFTSIEYSTALNRQYILVYDTAGTLLLCAASSANSGEQTFEAIKKRFPTATSIRHCKIAANGTYSVLSPPERIL